MSTASASRSRTLTHVLACITAVAALLCGCAAPQQTVLTEELPFEEAVAKATEGLLAQTQKLPGFLTRVESRLGKRSVVIDPMIDAGSGQQTAATLLLERRAVERIARFEGFETLPFQSANLARAQYLLTGTMTRVAGERGRATFRINLALTEIKPATVVAQASAVARGEGIDATPTSYYRDSPIILKDRVIEGYVATTGSAPGQRADAYYMERIAVATLINEATTLYNAEKYQEALAQYRSATSTPAGQQLRALNGLYLANWKLGRMAEAEDAFRKVVNLGIAYRELGVKFLFNPGSTEFWSDTKLSGAYGMWLRQIAREGVASKVCMNVLGHTSRTGSEQANNALSLQRADYIRQRLATEAPQLGPRLKAAGMGFRQNVIGSGTDNALDALDRRVEFKIVDCG